MCFQHRCLLPNQICIPVIRAKGQTNNIFCFEFSTPSLCVPSSGSRNITKLYTYFKVQQHFSQNVYHMSIIDILRKMLLDSLKKNLCEAHLQ